MKFILPLIVSFLASNVFAANSFNIVGGIKIKENTPLASSIVAIWDTEQEFMCTGTIISPSVIMTAAHCLVSHPSKLRIGFGVDAYMTLFAREVDVQKEFVRRVLGGRIHEGYIQDESKQPPIDQNDIALLKFDGPLPAGYRPMPLLQDPSMLAPGTETVVAGYGSTQVKVEKIDLKTMDPRKLKLGLRLGTIQCEADMKQCFSIVKSGLNDLFAAKVRIKSFSKLEVRTDESRGQSSCSGDSGGPAMVIKNGVYHMYGIVTRGPIECNSYGVYTNATKYLPWIQETVVRFESIGKKFAPPMFRR